MSSSEPLSIVVVAPGGIANWRVASAAARAGAIGCVDLGGLPGEPDPRDGPFAFEDSNPRNLGLRVRAADRSAWTGWVSRLPGAIDHLILVIDDHASLEALVAGGLEPGTAAR